MILFETFYQRYPRKEGKKSAEKAWLKLDNPTREKAITGLDKRNLFWKRERTQKQYIPMPAVWLNQKRWEDEFEEVQSSPSFREAVFNSIEKNRQLIENREQNKELAKDCLEFVQKILSYPQGVSKEKLQYEASWASRMAQKYPSHGKAYLDQESRAIEALNALQMEESLKNHSMTESHHFEMVRVAKEVLGASIISHAPKQEKRLEDLL